jgi:hypothetical protein
MTEKFRVKKSYDISLLRREYFLMRSGTYFLSLFLFESI